MCVEFLDAGHQAEYPLWEVAGLLPLGAVRDSNLFFLYYNQCCLFSDKIKEKGSESLFVFLFVVVVVVCFFGSMKCYLNQ